MCVLPFPSLGGNLRGIVMGLNSLPQKYTSSSICTPTSFLVSHLGLLHTQLSAGGKFILCYKGPSRPSPGHISQCFFMALSTKVWALSNSSCTFLACSKAVPSSLHTLSCPTFFVCMLSGTVTVSSYKGRKRSPFLPADSVHGITLARFISSHCKNQILLPPVVNWQNLGSEIVKYSWAFPMWITSIVAAEPAGF